MKDPKTIHSTTQDFLDLHDVVNDLAIFKDGSAALILSLDSVNFDLLAENEQDAIIYSYAGLLNSLNYPIQLVIRSQTKDVSNYLKALQTQEEESLSELKKTNIREYRQFVSELIQERNVLDKKFYVVIPATALELGLLSAQSVIPGIKPKAVGSFDKSVVLDKAMTVLYPKRDHLVAQFARIGLYARQLSTQEIIQLFYVNHNPEASEGQELGETNSYTTPLVQLAPKGAPMINANIPPTGIPTTATPVQPTTPPMPPVAPEPPVATEAMPLPTPAPITNPVMVPSMTPPMKPISPMTPSTPAAMPTMPVPTMPAPDNEAQAQINNTLGEIGSEAVPTPTASPASMPTPIAGAEPAPLPEI